MTKGIPFHPGGVKRVGGMHWEGAGDWMQEESIRETQTITHRCKNTMPRSEVNPGTCEAGDYKILQDMNPHCDKGMHECVQMYGNPLIANE